MKVPKTPRYRKKMKIPPVALKKWLEEHPRGSQGGRPPVEFTLYTKELDSETAQELALACCQVLMVPPKNRGGRQEIILKVPFNFFKTQKVLQNGRIVGYDESGWWMFVSFNAAKVMERLYDHGLVEMSYSDFTRARKAAKLQILDILKELDEIVPSEVYLNVEQLAETKRG